MPHPIETASAAFLMMSLCWVLSLRLRDVSIVDILWAPAFAVIAGLCALVASVTERGWLVLALVFVWAIRLGTHIWLRRRKLGHEDYRYAAIREKRGPNFPFTSLFWIFWLQALLLWIVSWPIQSAIGSARSLNWLDALGALFAAAGIVIEAIADAQLSRFRSNPKSNGSVLDRGLWAWCRHPNYFGD